MLLAKEVRENATTSKASAKRLDFSLDFSLYKNLVKNLVVWPPCIELYSIHFPCIVFLILIKNISWILKLYSCCIVVCPLSRLLYSSRMPTLSLLQI